ncbi:hypothetical protein ACQPXH_01450 [Nocardia sp. CA-135953]|uniref:hypothetical protein n=1 Tax=Nocardia sp. CA-135953 TaxID=3239978 RepID=UPI003D95A4B8
MTREQFGDKLGWATSTIQKWEHGGTRAVLADRAACLDETLAALNPEQLERFTAALTEAGSTEGVHAGGTAATFAADEEDDMRRRTFGTFAVAAAATTLSPAARIGKSDVARLEAISAELETDMQRQGGAALVDDAVAALDRGLALVDTATFDGTTGRHLMSAVGNLAAQTGWLAYDADRHALARKCFTEAMSLAGTVDDDWLTAYACLTAALQPINLARNGIGSASRALPLIARAADAMRRQPPSRVHALIAVREAAALGVLGDADRFGQAIATAWRELERAERYESVDDCPQWVRFVTPQEIRGHEARGCAAVGRIRAALGLYEVAVTEHASPSNIANMGAWAASAHAQVGDLDGALARALPVVTQLESAVMSPRTVRTLIPVRKALETVPAGADFCARFDALDAKGSVSA